MAHHDANYLMTHKAIKEFMEQQMTIKVRVRKGDSRAVLDMITEEMVKLEQPLTFKNRGVFDEADSHYCLVWFKAQDEIPMKQLIELSEKIQARFETLPHEVST